MKNKRLLASYPSTSIFGTIAQREQLGSYHFLKSCICITTILVRVMIVKLIDITNGNPENPVDYYVKHVKKRETEEKKFP